ncbi:MULTISPECIES: phosphotransferase [Cupriavidus]|uniref:Phosphotransferase family protein n=1 Tax=Cupriavidus lacunae TaxID=2666307 RepID=A0A370NWX7_9BURK|nr:MULTISPECIES: phosphotransferase [Cupriavidus]KWR87833.1 aminoglycoside phosphotransferase [Cupriavidus sp. IDO]RDK10096.1 phosphotransferase family protein [Cupriavidus lacunae]
MTLHNGSRPGEAAQGTFHLDAARLERWLEENVSGFRGPVSVSRFQGGQSNPTYRLTSPSGTYVLRSKPAPKARLLPSAHAIEREFRIQRALAGTDVPVAKVYALCEDEAVIGRAFYVMECLQGRVFWDPSLPGMAPAERAAIYHAMHDALAALHRVKPGEAGLSDFGKPGNYFQRQIERWSKQYRSSETARIAAMDELMEWLPSHIPPEDAPPVSIVHGDFRIDNLIFHPTEPVVLGILDWELSTLGHPLADFSYLCMYWDIPPDVFRGLGGLDLAALGIPDMHAYRDSYLASTGLTVTGDWNFYLAYNLFRMAAILQGVLKRALDGMAASDDSIRNGLQVAALAELGLERARQANR